MTSVIGRVPPKMFDGLLGRITLADPRRETAPLRAPFTGEVVREVPVGREADVNEALRRAHEAQNAWAQLGFGARGRIFLRYHDLVLDRQDELLDMIQIETGKARKHAFEEVADLAIVSRYYALHAEEHLRPRKRMGALPGLTATWEYHHPLGVIGFISPWNYPLSLAMTDAIPALLAGNAVVLKPDQQTPFTALLGVDLLYQAGLPEGLFQVVTGRGRELGQPLIQGSNYICFTGSTQTGRTIARQAGESLINCSLELGGKNPMVVMEDADIDRTVEGALRACFANAGQLCISIERMYVHRKIADRFLGRFAARARDLRVGASFDYDVDVGSLVSKDQLDKVQHHVEDAVARGATVLAGGKARPDIGPYFFEPTILTDVTEKMSVHKEETFGPLVSVYPFETVDEVVAMANATAYGLNASIWAGSTDRARRLATRIQAGTVNINEAYAATWASVDAPMGGFKDSGLGRRHGAQGIQKYTEAQTVSVQRLLPIAAPPGMSDRTYAQLMSQALRLMKWIPGIR